MFNTSLTHDREANLRHQREERLQTIALPDRSWHVTLLQRLTLKLFSRQDLFNALMFDPSLAATGVPSPEMIVPDGRMALVFGNGAFHGVLPSGRHRVPSIAERVEVRFVLPETAAALSNGAQGRPDELPCERALRYLDGALVEIVRYPASLAKSERDVFVERRVHAGFQVTPAKSKPTPVLRDLPSLLPNQDEEGDAMDTYSYV